MELQKQKAEKSARQQLARKLNAQAKAAGKAKSKSDPSSAPGGKKIKKGGDGDDLSSMPHDKQIEVLQAKINQEKELEKLISSCATHIKLPDKLPITRITASDKVKGAASKSKQLEQQLQRTKAAQAAQAEAKEDVTVEFGYKVWKDHSAELSGRVVNQHICHMPASKHSKTCKYRYIYIIRLACSAVLHCADTTPLWFLFPKAIFTFFGDMPLILRWRSAEENKEEDFPDARHPEARQASLEVNK
jgi:hypothetical protein